MLPQGFIEDFPIRYIRDASILCRQRRPAEPARPLPVRGVRLASRRAGLYQVEVLRARVCRGGSPGSGLLPPGSVLREPAPDAVQVIGAALHSLPALAGC